MECSFDDSSSSTPHVVLFPFMSKGHIIPLLHFAHLLLRRDITVTVVTTPSNRPFISQSLQGSAATVAVVPFHHNLTEIPAGVETTDHLPSMSLFYQFAVATSLMQPHFERLLVSLPRVSFMVSDGFLWWTLESATKFGIPRFVFYGMSNYSHTLSKEASHAGIFTGPHSSHHLQSLPRFPWIRLCKDDFDPVFLELHRHSEAMDFHMKAVLATVNSQGLIVNSFYELEPVFADYLKTESSPKPWCVGPLNLVSQKTLKNSDSSWIQWLDQKLEEKQSVLYVAFGSQAEVSTEQLVEIASGLEESKVNFLWVIRKKEWELPMGFEERVKERGMITRDWVDQTEILMHLSVNGFLSHCGWNSVLESVCAGVPILALPMMAEQPLNAKMVEEEIKVGLRVKTLRDCNVKREEVEKKVKELMEGDKGKEARKKVKELAEMAEKAVGDGGSSWRTLETLISETCGKKETTSGSIKQ